MTLSIQAFIRVGFLIEQNKCRDLKRLEKTTNSRSCKSANSMLKSPQNESFDLNFCKFITSSSNFSKKIFTSPFVDRYKLSMIKLRSFNLIQLNSKFNSKLNWLTSI